MIPQFVVPFPVRAIPCETTSLGAAGTLTLSGSEGRQRRYLLIVTNLDTSAKALKLQTVNGRNLLTFFALTSIGLPITEDVVLYNPNDTTVNFEVCQLYYDEGTLSNEPLNYPGSLREGAYQASYMSSQNRSGTGPAPTGGGRSTGR